MGCSRGGKRPQKQRQDQSDPMFTGTKNGSKWGNTSSKKIYGPNKQHVIPPVVNDMNQSHQKSKSNKSGSKNGSTSPKHGSMPNTEQHVLPPIVNDVSMDDLLRECEDANPDLFVLDGDNDADGYNPDVDAPDVHSARPNNVLDTQDDTSSDEDNDIQNEQVNVPSVNEIDDVPSESSRRATRGYARPHILTAGQVRPKVYIFLGELIGDEVPGWFLTEIRFEWHHFWPKWKHVDSKVKERLWNSFKNYFDLQCEESSARRLFFKQSSKWYREAMSTTKKDALKHAKTKDVKDLIGSRRPPWMFSSTVWKLFVQHWNDPDTVRVSNSAKRSRASTGAGCHGLGNVGLKRRMKAIQDKTGTCPSPFIILLEQNRKKNNVTGVDEVYNLKFHKAWEKYVVLFKSRYGEELEPMNYPPDLQLWDAIEEVSQGRKKGRRLGFGTIIQSNIFNTISQSTYTSNNSGDLETQKLLADEVGKRKALEEEVKLLKAKTDQQSAANDELRLMFLKLEQRMNLQATAS